MILKPEPVYRNGSTPEALGGVAIGGHGGRRQKASKMPRLRIGQDRNLSLRNSTHYTPELKKALDEGSVVLGGREIGASMPYSVCMDCGTDFRRSERKLRTP